MLLAIRLLEAGFDTNPAPSSPAPRAVHPEAIGPSDPQPAAMREALDDGVVRLRTTDAQGTPICSVAIVPHGAGSGSPRVLLADLAQARTGEDGVARLDGSSCPIGSAWTLCKPGYQVRELVIGSERHYDVVMLAGNAIRITVVDSDGQPVPAASVFASSQVLPTGPELAALTTHLGVYVPYGDAALQSCSTDDHGHAQLAGFPTGSIHVEVVKQGWLRTRLEPYPQAVPCGSITAVMQPAYVAAASVVGDAVLSSFLDKPRGASGLVTARLDDVAAEARQALKTDICAAYARSPRIDEPVFLSRFVTCRLLLKDTGYLSCDIPLQRADQAQAAFVVDATTRTPVSYGSLVLTIRNHGGAALPPDRNLPLVVVPQDIPKSGVFGIAIDSGREIRLPCGRYRLLAVDDVLGEMLPDRGDIHVAAGPNQSDVELSGTLVPVQLQILDSKGIRWPYATYRVTYVDRHTVQTGILKNDTDRTLWWRAGMADVSVSCDDRTNTVSGCAITWDGSGRGMQIELTL